MIAARIGPELRMAVAGAPSYFRSHVRPRTPNDLTDHAGINIRMQTKGGLYTLGFGRDGRDLHARVEGPLILNDVPMILVAAVEGIGLACIMDYQAEALLKAGKLVRVREDWCPPFFGYHLYYPYRGQLPSHLDPRRGASLSKMRRAESRNAKCALASTSIRPVLAAG